MTSIAGYDSDEGGVEYVDSGAEAEYVDDEGGAEYVDDDWIARDERALIDPSG